MHSSRQSTRRPQRFDNMRADGFLLRELQFSERTIADVVVRDVSARVVQESADAVLGHTSSAALAGVYTIYYNTGRVHISLEKDAPCGRQIERFGDIVAHAILGGLHHRYARI